METHSGDSPINRFFSYWGALFSFVAFGILVLLFVAFERTLADPDQVDPDDARRTELDTATLAEQAALVNTWKKNADGTYEVPAEVALAAMAKPDRFSKPAKSEVPVPGTAAADAAAAALMEAAGAAPAEGESSEPAKAEQP